MTPAVELVTTSPSQTHAVAEELMRVVGAGDVIALTGELGAGKTCFVQGCAAALGVQERVTSPSFVLRKEYQGRLPVLHLDVYRLESLQEVVDIGFGDDWDGVTFVEWGDAMSALLPGEHLEVEVRLPPLDAEHVGAAGQAGGWVAEPRHVTLRAHGPGWARRLATLQLDRWAADDGRA